MNAPVAMLGLFAGSSLVMFPAVTSTAGNENPEPRQDWVVLLHGLGRTALSMKRLEFGLKNHGYRVLNVSYPSTRFSVAELSAGWLRPLLEKKIPASATKIHFVTHSLGGIILRQYLSHHRLEKLGRVVMLAPPNHGSEVIDRLKANPLARNLLGPTLLELGTDSAGVPNKLGPIQFECGVISGDRSINPVLSRALPGPNDGKVTLESAKVEGMRDFLVLHSTHTWLMWRTRTLRQTLRFLESGQFDHQGSLDGQAN